MHSTGRQAVQGVRVYSGKQTRRWTARTAALRTRLYAWPAHTERRFERSRCAAKILLLAPNFYFWHRLGLLSLFPPLPESSTSRVELQGHLWQWTPRRDLAWV
jgi:hypothetical protein